MKKLKGKNRIRKFRQIAESLRSQIASLKGITGIIFLGGLERGFADKYSDIDITVLLDKNDEKLRREIRKIGSDEQERSGVDIDLEVHCLEDFGRLRWDENHKWDFSHAQVVYDTRGKVQNLLKAKTRVRRNFWTRRIAVYVEYMKWYCCSPEKNAGTFVETWINRGDLISAHYCATYALDLLIRILFALNREFLPSQKWRIFYSYNLKWLPTNYEKLLNEAMAIKGLSRLDLKRRSKALRKMWAETLTKVKEETGLTPDLISKYYVERILHQI
jgi:predicted nucleotidyltransferase